MILLLGEALSNKFVNSVKGVATDICVMWNLYGPAESTIVSICHKIDRAYSNESISIGRPSPNYKCIITDELLQLPFIGQEGELLVEGVGIFAGYLGRDDLTAKALTEINGEIYYRTGDLVRMDNNGLLHYQGRKDHQIKLHGQRIELGEIERCLLNTSISACVVMKWGDHHLVAYVQTSDMNEEQLRQHCQSHLPPHMIPSIFIILDKLPLNVNGKIDRKHLPTTQFSAMTQTDHMKLLQLTPLEEHLRRIFSEAFHNELPDVTMSFGRMGGTSLDAIRAIWLIRQEIYTKMDAGLLFANPSIRQLAHAIQPFLVIYDNLSSRLAPSQPIEDQDRPMPSLSIELVGILLLISQWLFPIWSAYYFNSLIVFVFVPVFHLLSYVVFQRLILRTKEIGRKIDKLYSLDYYQWWFLNNMWSINNSYWLKHLVGTAFYNSYLRFCGAKIERHSHIYTTLIDTPWLIEIGESTLIGEEVVLSSLTYQDRTYELDRIQIGSRCSINIRSVVYGSVVIDDDVYVKPMSSVTGHVEASNDKISIIDQSLSFSQTIYQLICLFCLVFIHLILIFLAYFVYSSCLTLFLPLPVSLASIWLIWILVSLSIVVLLLKFIVGSVTCGHYPLNSHYYLQKLWLRQLIITSFHHSLSFVPSYDILASIIFRWLGAHIEEDVTFAEFQHILCFPLNLLRIEHGVTMFGGVKLASFEMTKEGLCYLDEIHLGFGTNLTNGCVIMPGTRISPEIIVGSLTLVTKKNVSDHFNGVLLGIPACEMPFGISDHTSVVNDNPSSNFPSICNWLIICLSFFISKCFLITLYSSTSLIIALFIHIIFFCVLYRYSNSTRKKRSYFLFSEIITRFQRFINTSISDFFVFLGPYLSGTQLLVFLFRILGAQIGSDVIISDIICLTDPHLVSIGDHVRLHKNAYIQVRYISMAFSFIVSFFFYLQCHTFERRLFKQAPITVNQSSVLMINTLVLSGSSLQGHNRILPITLVMKNDQLSSNTTWSGVPARRLI